MKTAVSILILMALIFNGDSLFCSQEGTMLNGNTQKKDNASRIEEINDRIRVENAYLVLAKYRFKMACIKYQKITHEEKNAHEEQKRFTDNEFKRDFVEYLISSGKIKHEMKNLHEEREKLKNEIRPKL